MHGWDSEQLLDAARSLRAYLGELVNDPTAFDRRLADLLERSRRHEDVEFELAELLFSTPETKAWTRLFLEERIPPKIERRGAPFSRMSGPVKVDRFDCPEGDFRWFRFAPGQRPPKCPTHATDLVRA